jgi:putative transposase
MLSLTTKQHDELLRIYRKDPDPELRCRAHILLLLAGGYVWNTIGAMLFCSSRTVDRWLKRFQSEGVAGLTGRKRGRPSRLGLGWVAVLVTWVTTQTPRDFGCLRSRWSCAVLALLHREREGVTARRETVRRWLPRGDLVYRRPRPILEPDERESPSGGATAPCSSSTWMSFGGGCAATGRSTSSATTRVVTPAWR